MFLVSVHLRGAQCQQQLATSLTAAGLANLLRPEALQSMFFFDFDIAKNGLSAAEVRSSTHTKYSWLSDEPSAKKRSVQQRTSYAKQKVSTAARHSC